MSPLHHLFESEIKDLYSAEKQLLNVVLPTLIDVSKTPCLKKGFNELVDKTNYQFKCIKHICKRLEINFPDEVCIKMSPIIKELNRIKERENCDNVKDMKLIASAQRIEYFKISGYSTATRVAKQLGYTEVAELLQSLLNHELYADNKLNELAIMRISNK